ncbi:shikimate kinase [Hazenella sp. IB182353]|uniref:shikimate kinase n=1 Tax=Polycladospora coralii TaxID=2771432 RepID=UPI001747CEBF|nr:shikimate kinase [Polycladospora coralii]MBS7530166.1 shikimate kinase [Polycladospora coralii]
MQDGKRHLILIGFMGTGKSTVGKAVAELLQVPWRDTDLSLETEWGHSIPEYFKRYGENAFRQAETGMLAKCLAEKPAVITTGGGIVLHPGNRDLMIQNGYVIHLQADANTIIKRVKQDDPKRPLLAGNQVEKKVQELMQEREGYYDFADFTIDTTASSLQKIINEVVQYWPKQAV